MTDRWILLATYATGEFLQHRIDGIPPRELEPGTVIPLRRYYHDEGTGKHTEAIHDLVIDRVHYSISEQLARKNWYRSALIVEAHELVAAEHTEVPQSDSSATTTTTTAATTSKASK